MIYEQAMTIGDILYLTSPLCAKYTIMEDPFCYIVLIKHLDLRLFIQVIKFYVKNMYVKISNINYCNISFNYRHTDLP